jgi:hypothetical protein
MARSSPLLLSRPGAPPRKQICLGIAGIRISVSSDDPELELAVGGAARRFQESGEEADVRVRALRSDALLERGEELFDSGGLWRMYRLRRSYLFRFTSPALGPLPYKTASFRSDFSSGEVRLRPAVFAPGRAVYPLEYPLDELLLIHLLAEGRGVEVHACGLTDGGKGLLFVGQSGAGKTTTARLWEGEEGVKVLSDDRIILRRIDGRIWMYGTPWHGEAGLAFPDHAPLTRVFFLRHGSRNEIRRESVTGATGRLFAASFPPFHSPSGLAFSLAFHEEVARSVPCEELRFLPEKGVVELVRQATA